MSLSDYVWTELQSLRGAEVFRVSRGAKKWWNEQRSDAHEVSFFCGWFWYYAGEEGGPYPTPSAAWRALYYKFVLRMPPPAITPDEAKRAERIAAKRQRVAAE